MNILKSAALVAAGLLALGGCQKAVDVAAVQDESKRAVRDWIAAYNAGDADTIAGMYAEDARVFAPGHPAAVGRDAIRETIAKDIANTKAAGVTLVLNDDDVVSVHGDIALHTGSYVVNDASGATVDSGNYLGVSQNIDGKWLLVRDVWNSDRPPAPAAAPAEAAAPS